MKVNNILILFIFIIIKIKTFSEFKIIRLSETKIIIIYEKGMSVYNKNIEIF